MKEVEIAYLKAIRVLKKCSTPNGFYAAFPGYNMVFARDAMIISLGASLLDDKSLKETFKKSLITLAKNQSKNGQIPNAVDSWSERKKHVDFKSIDSTLWFLIGSKIYEQRYEDLSFSKKYKNNIARALTWLSYEDICERGLLDQLPTTDWEDAFPHKYGHTIHDLALYFKVLNLYNEKAHAASLKKIVNSDKDDGLWNEKYYLAWRWKNHNRFKEEGKWFDTLGNLLAIVFGLADGKKAEKILSYIEKNKINEPFPVKSIWPPISKHGKEWQDYFEDCDAREPYHYLNAGIWTFIGGFYVCALVKMGKIKEAEKQLEKLAIANLQKPEFSEWLEGKTGKSGRSSAEGNDGGQGWNAAMYLVAYESAKRKRNLVS